MKSVILIPARLASTRFPNKPLASILGKPMIQWVFEAAEKSKATDVFIASGDDEIISVVEGFNGQAIKTFGLARNGTERCQEALELLASEGKNYDVVLNVQGDEPLIDPQDLDALIDLFDEDDVDIATLITLIEKEEEYRNPTVVKAIPTLFEDDYCDICYFSRAPIPYMAEFQPNIACKHIGVYAFTVTAFDEISNLEPTGAEETESLEQLRWLQNHMVISGILAQSELCGVDTEDDLKQVEAILNQR